VIRAGGVLRDTAMTNQVSPSATAQVRAYPQLYAQVID
jgi:hypothetical protein